MIKNKFGYISLVGKPNVGKSTLFNKIFGNNYSAISHKRHTTRESLFGILTFQNCQFCFYDNPGYGYEKNYRSEDKSNKSLNQQVDNADIILFLTSFKINSDDFEIINKFEKKKIIWLISKIDLVSDKSLIYKLVDDLTKKYEFTEIFPVNLLDSDYKNTLLTLLKKHLPFNNHEFNEKKYINASKKKISAEIIRGEIFRFCNYELPYVSKVEIIEFKYKGKLIYLNSYIWVKRNSQKLILLGSSGSKLKKILTHSRIKLEKLFKRKIFIDCTIKISNAQK